MLRLNAKLLEAGAPGAAGLKWSPLEPLPERVLQIGEGNFLRGFADWMFDAMNRRGLFNGKVVLVQPTPNGHCAEQNEQDCLYTLILRGVRDGRIVEERKIIGSISRGIDPYADFAAFLDCAGNPALRVIVSNTTEAGIAYAAGDRLADAPPASFPGKLTVFLYERYRRFAGDPSKGFILLPCELIDRNGDALKAIVLRLAKEWGLAGGFVEWLGEANYFLNTLVDRIVTGYPREEAAELFEELGYEDRGLDTAELFHSWVIEGDERLAEELPFAEAGLNVIWTGDMTPYRSRKVRILNGAHTMMALAAYLSGAETVKDCMDDPVVRSFMDKGVREEIIPTLDQPEAELTGFADSVAERFANPFIEHRLLSIALNSTSKFKVRCLPSLLLYSERTGRLPEALVFSLAALIAFYRGTEIRDRALVGSRDGREYRILDDEPVLEGFRGLWSAYDGTASGAEAIVRAVLGEEGLWGRDLGGVPGLPEAVGRNLRRILEAGAGPAMEEVLGRGRQPPSPSR